jgi:hypothetical protein
LCGGVSVAFFTSPYAFFFSTQKQATTALILTPEEVGRAAAAAVNEEFRANSKQNCFEGAATIARDSETKTQSVKNVMPMMTSAFIYR